MDGLPERSLTRDLGRIAGYALVFALLAAPSPARAGDAQAATAQAASAQAASAQAAPAQAAIAPLGSAPSVTHGEAWRALVREGIELDLHGRHDEADAMWDRLERADPTDPEPWLRRVDTVYWRHWYDEGRGLSEKQISGLLGRSKALAERRLDADRDDLRARWLLGEVLMQEARFEGTRGNYMKAGTQGERGRKQLEALLDDQPDHLEARYTLGLYYYFASLMPDVVQKMSWLWFIPKGDRDRGLDLLGQARASSSLYGPSASMVLMTIHTYQQPEDIPTALGIANELHATYPENAILHFELLEVLLKAQRHDQLLAEAFKLEARRGESDGITNRAILATIWRARSAAHRGRSDEARTIAFGLDAADPELPEWGAPWLWLVRAHVLDLEGDRTAALAAYERVLELGTDDFYSQRPKRMANAGIATPFRPDPAFDEPIMTSLD